MTSTKAPGPGYNLMVEQHLLFAEAIVGAHAIARDGCPFCEQPHCAPCGVVLEAFTVVDQARACREAAEG